MPSNQEGYGYGSVRK